MQRVLFHSTVFGPIHSRRLGSSLGINLSPVDGKTCTFDCLYCEAGFNSQGAGSSGLPSRDQTAIMLEDKLKDMRSDGQTLHPEFAGIVDDTLLLRDRYFPDAVVSVLCNSTRLDKEDVVSALMKVDNAILKLDSAIDSTMRQIDRPTSAGFNTAWLIDRLKMFGDKAIIQTMFLRGEYEGMIVDNTTDKEVEALLDAYCQIRPREVMIYSIDRKTPARDLQKVSIAELEAIAAKVRAEGIRVQVN